MQPLQTGDQDSSSDDDFQTPHSIAEHQAHDFQDALSGGEEEALKAACPGDNASKAEFEKDAEAAAQSAALVSELSDLKLGQPVVHGKFSGSSVSSNQEQEEADAREPKKGSLPETSQSMDTPANAKAESVKDEDATSDSLASTISTEQLSGNSPPLKMPLASEATSQETSSQEDGEAEPWMTQVSEALKREGYPEPSKTSASLPSRGVASSELERPPGLLPDAGVRKKHGSGKAKRSSDDGVDVKVQVASLPEISSQSGKQDNGVVPEIVQPQKPTSHTPRANAPDILPPAPPPHEIKPGTFQFDDDEEDEPYDLLTAEEEQKLEEAEGHKQLGNDHYKAQKFIQSIEAYKEALNVAPAKSQENIAVYHANLAQAYIMLKNWPAAIKSATCSLRTRPKAEIKVKALRRRAQAYEAHNENARAQADFEELRVLEPEQESHKQNLKRLGPIVAEEQERQKEEMLDKLKELGNTVLGKFGMSLDSFKAEKDPVTGQYSISMKQ